MGALFLVSLGTGWWLSGRALRPVRRITATAQEISATDLSRRIALDGPQDELRNLADTVDDMLGRLESAFVSQRQLVDDASHELRNPLAVIQANVDAVLAHDDTTPDDRAQATAIVSRAIQRMTRLVEDLLASARRSSPAFVDADVDLAAIAGEAAEEYAAPRGRPRTSRRTAPVAGTDRGRGRIGAAAGGRQPALQRGPAGSRWQRAGPGRRQPQRLGLDRRPRRRSRHRRRGRRPRLRPLLPLRPAAVPVHRPVHRATPRRPGPGHRPPDRRIPRRHRRPPLRTRRRQHLRPLAPRTLPHQHHPPNPHPPRRRPPRPPPVVSTTDRAPACGDRRPPRRPQWPRRSPTTTATTTSVGSSQHACSLDPLQHLWPEAPHPPPRLPGQVAARSGRLET